MNMPWYNATELDLAPIESLCVPFGNYKDNVPTTSMRNIPKIIVLVPVGSVTNNTRMYLKDERSYNF
jgi:hypothetical protein